MSNYSMHKLSAGAAPVADPSAICFVRNKSQTGFDIVVNTLQGVGLPLRPNYLPVLGVSNLLMYYGVPISYKGLGTAQSVIADIAVNFKYWIPGAGVEDPTHPNYSTTVAIITGLRAAGVKVFGYVPTGTSTSNLTQNQMQTRITNWNTIGVDGIFLDEFGFDYSNTRTRQKAVVDYVHGLSLPVCVNAYVFEDFVCDAFAELTWAGGDWRLTNFQTYNPTQLALTRLPGDCYLADGICFTNAGPTTASASHGRLASINSVNATKNIEIWLSATVAESAPGTPNTGLIGTLTTKEEIADYVGATALQCDVSVAGVTGNSKGASGTPLDIVIPQMPVGSENATTALISNYGTGYFTRSFGGFDLVIQNTPARQSTTIKRKRTLGSPKPEAVVYFQTTQPTQDGPWIWYQTNASTGIVTNIYTAL